jgi:hypothetical protein
MKFGPSNKGLYYYDFQESIKCSMEKEQYKSCQVLTVQTVEEMQRNYTEQGAEAARRMYVLVGRPSGRHLKRY